MGFWHVNMLKFYILLLFERKTNKQTNKNKNKTQSKYFLQEAKCIPYVKHSTWKNKQNKQTELHKWIKSNSQEQVLFEQKVVIFRKLEKNDKRKCIIFPIICLPLT